MEKNNHIKPWDQEITPHPLPENQEDKILAKARCLTGKSFLIAETRLEHCYPDHWVLHTRCWRIHRSKQEILSPGKRQREILHSMMEQTEGQAIVYLRGTGWQEKNNGFWVRPRP